HLHLRSFPTRRSSDLLELDASDLGVSWRFLNRRTERSSGKEIVLYDRTPGGAGFVAEVRERWSEMEAKAREICDCPVHCEHACRSEEHTSELQSPYDL